MTTIPNQHLTPAQHRGAYSQVPQKDDLRGKSNKVTSSREHFHSLEFAPAVEEQSSLAYTSAEVVSTWTTALGKGNRVPEALDSEHRTFSCGGIIYA